MLENICFKLMLFFGKEMYAKMLSKYINITFFNINNNI